MINFFYGMLVGLIFIAAMAVANRTTDSFTRQIASRLDEADRATFLKLLHFKLDRILEAVFIIVMFFLGFGCKALLG